MALLDSIFLKFLILKKVSLNFENLISLCYSVKIQHSTSERILKMGLLVFEFIHYKQKYNIFLFITLVQISAVVKFSTEAIPVILSLQLFCLILVNF